MTLSQFLTILRARWATVLLILLGSVGLAIGVSLILPKQYTATATVVVDQTRPDPVTGAAINAGNPTPSFMSTQVDILKSDRVTQAVARKLGMVDDPAVRERWMSDTEGRGSFEAWLTDKVQLSLDVKPSRDSNVISVSFKDADPENAARAANQFVQSYLDVMVALRVDPAKQYSSFFDSRARELRANVERAQSRLSAYQREKGVVIATDGQIDVETARLNELSSQLVALQAVAAESSSRQLQAQAGAGDRLQEVINNPALAALRGDLTRAEAKLQELNSRLGENHPQVIEAKANISTLRSQLNIETRRVTGSVGVSDSINRRREAELRAALETQRQRVLKLRTAREEGAVLVKEVDAAQRAYDAVLQRQSQTSLESQASQSAAHVLAQAVAPYTPSSPNLLRNAILAVVIGTVLAIAAAIVSEYVDRRVRTEDEVSDVLGLPLLGVLPKPGGKGRFAGPRVPLVRGTGMLRRLPAPGKEA
jgi:chain length determinant protein EpsF